MEEIKYNPILEFNENQLKSVRELVGYEDVNKLKQDLEILKAWSQKQHHFTVKDFDPEYLERLLIYNKGSVETAKLRLDKVCTYVTLMPEFMTNFDIRKEFRPLLNIANICLLPKPTKDFYRVLILQMNGEEDNKFDLTSYYRYHVLIGYYALYTDYCVGYEFIGDYRKLTMGTLAKFNPLIVSKGLKLVMETIGEKVKRIHLLSGSKFMDTLLLFAKQGVSPKMRERIIVHPNIESLCDYFTRGDLPKDYGGNQKNVKELSDLNYHEWSSDSQISRMKFLESTATNESARLSCKTNEEYSGVPGSFKQLCID